MEISFYVSLWKRNRKNAVIYSFLLIFCRKRR